MRNVALKGTIGTLVEIETTLIDSSEVDIQAIANELNTAAKYNRELYENTFNELVHLRISYILANLERAKLQDLVILLSAFGLRISRSMPGTNILMKSGNCKKLINSIADYICQGDTIEKASYTQVATLIWAFAVMQPYFMR